MNQVGYHAVQAREAALVHYAMCKLVELPYVTIIGSIYWDRHHGVISFNIDGIHPHDVASILDMQGVCIRAGHHCAQPLLTWLGVENLACCRASLGVLQRQARRGRLHRRPRDRLAHLQRITADQGAFRMGNIYTSTTFMEHNSHPDYKYEMDSPTHSHDGINPSCGDELTLQLRIENDVIEEASFTGHGCAISQASADIMADLITGETVKEAKRLSGLFLAMIRGDELSEEDYEDLDEAAQLKDISHMPARVKCAELAWRTLDGMLD